MEGEGEDAPLITSERRGQEARSEQLTGAVGLTQPAGEAPMRGAALIAAITLPFLVAAVPLAAWLQFEEAPEAVRVQLPVAWPDTTAASFGGEEAPSAAWAATTGTDESPSTEGCRGASSS